MHSPPYYLVLTELRWLAAPAARQLARFVGTPALVADELALEWDNAWRVAEGLLQGQQITASTYATLTRVNAELARIPPTSELWSDEALAHDPCWERFREAARAILGQLGESYQDPELDETSEGGFHSVIIV